MTADVLASVREGNVSGLTIAWHPAAELVPGDVVAQIRPPSRGYLIPLLGQSARRDRQMLAHVSRLRQAGVVTNVEPRITGMVIVTVAVGRTNLNPVEYFPDVLFPVIVPNTEGA